MCRSSVNVDANPVADISSGGPIRFLNRSRGTLPAVPHPLSIALRDLSRLYNYTETLIWPVMGLILLAVAARRQGVVRRDYALAGVVLLIFGASDYAEAENGNEWWTPWWLFLWKAACVAALLGLLVAAWRRTRKTRTASVSVTEANVTVAQKAEEVG